MTIPPTAEWLPVILDHVEATAYARDRAGRLVYANRRCENVLGFPRAEMIGKTNAELFPSDASTLDANDERIWLTGEAEELIEHLFVDGESRTFASHKFPLRDAVGEIVAVAGISVDVTDRTRAEGGLRRVRELTRRIVESVADGQSASGASSGSIAGKSANGVTPAGMPSGAASTSRHATSRT